MKILLIGKTGQVGQELTRSLLPLGDLTALDESQLNLRNHQAVISTLAQLKPDVIVNAAAYTAVDKAEAEKEIAWDINATVVGTIAEYAKKHDALFVHYSTDYVFNGEKKTAYQETDPTNPLNVYGASKLAGEQAIAASGCRHLTFRTSWVFSAHGHNFIKTIFKLARDKTSLSIINDQLGAPTSAELLADVTAHAIIAHQQNQFASGLYHLTANGVTSWHGLACYMLEQTKKHQINFALKSSNIQPILSAAYPVSATRPKNSQLDTSHLSKQLNITLPDWTAYVDRMINQLIQMRFFA
ncbi:MAG: dTDP-4-dehydrorhamnose reductase [Legionella sp.]|nr:dTDP-4-dehydrorhamnose reductase [Legionella sp.]